MYSIKNDCKTVYVFIEICNGIWIVCAILMIKHHFLFWMKIVFRLPRRKRNERTNKWKKAKKKKNEFHFKKQKNCIKQTDNIHWFALHLIYFFFHLFISINLLPFDYIFFRFCAVLNICTVLNATSWSLSKKKCDFKINVCRLYNNLTNDVRNHLESVFFLLVTLYEYHW